MTPNKDYLLNLLSGNDVTFFIPPYQRNYEWDDSQCDVFFKDLIHVAMQTSPLRINISHALRARNGS